MIEIFEMLISVEFWIQVLDGCREFGPLAPILLTALESLIPALPLVVIVTFNITVHGALTGFLCSWIGTSIGCTMVFLFFRKIVKGYSINWIQSKPVVEKAFRWVNQVNEKVLFLVAMMPFTPSVFVNLAFGLSDYDEKRFLVTLICAKSVMMLLLLGFGSSVAASFEKPAYLILAAVLLIALYLVSKFVGKKSGL